MNYSGKSFNGFMSVACCGLGIFLILENWILHHASVWLQEHHSSKVFKYSLSCISERTVCRIKKQACREVESRNFGSLLIHLVGTLTFSDELWNMIDSCKRIESWTQTVKFTSVVVTARINLWNIDTLRSAGSFRDVGELIFYPTHSNSCSVFCSDKDCYIFVEFSSTSIHNSFNSKSW